MKRFFFAIAVVATLVVTLAVPVLGGGQASATDGHDHGGCTPGFWKNNEDPWGPTGYSPSDSFEAVFGTAPDPFSGSPSLLDVLNLGGGGVNALSRHAVAALLNASHPAIGYPLTPSVVIAKYQEALATGGFLIEVKKDLFEDFNESGCPIDAHGDPI